MKKSITVKDIAKLAGVSITTVSRVLNGDETYSMTEAVRKRVLETARKYEYAPQNAARSLVSRKSYKLGVILHRVESDLGLPYFGEIFCAFCREAIRHNYQTLLLPVENYDCDQEVLNSIRAGNADAYLIGATMIGSQTMRELKERQLPVAVYIADSLFSDPLPETSIFRMELEAAFRAMFLELRERGFREFALFSSEPLENVQRFRELRRGAEYGIRCAEIIFYSQRHDFFQALDVIRTAEEKWEQLSRHELILCRNDMAALALCETIRRHGLIPGKDISVIGFDGIEDALLGNTPNAPLFLSTIATHLADFGTQMADFLLRKIARKDAAPEEIAIPATFEPRESLGFSKYSTHKEKKC